jgi:ElaB/YqjD/DUF883 family membrane-anchored ribosome-binding protein
MADIGYELKQDLINDAHLRVARALLEESRDDLQNKIQELENTLSSIDRLMAAAGRPREVTSAIASTQAELDKVEASLASLEKVEANLSPQLIERAETYVRTECPEFLKGLAAVKDFADWPRSIERFHRKIEAYLRALGTARNMITSGYNMAEKRISKGAEEALVLAIFAASELEEETAFINRVADAHESAVADTPHSTVVLPRVPVASFREWTERLRQLNDIAAIQAEFARILGMCELLKSTGVVALDEAVKRATEEHRELSQSFVLGYLRQLRAYADEHWFKREETASRVQRLEREMLGHSNFPFELES